MIGPLRASPAVLAAAPASAAARREPDAADTQRGGGAVAAHRDGDKPGSPDDAQSREEQRVLRELQARDREVRAHEAAHLGAAGGLARGGASFSYQRGPDGQLYAVAGEVSIDTSPGTTPQDTLERARRIRAAALAPATPSAQDRAVAARAAQMALEAQIDLAAERRDARHGAAPADAGHGTSAGAALALYRANAPENLVPPQGRIDLYV